MIEMSKGDFDGRISEIVRGPVKPSGLVATMKLFNITRQDLTVDGVRVRLEIIDEQGA